MMLKSCKSILASALVAACLFSPSAVKADPIQYVFDLTYEGVDQGLDPSDASDNTTYFGKGFFQFKSPFNVDFDAGNTYVINDYAPFETIFNLSFFTDSEYTSPSLIPNISTTSFGPVSLIVETERVYFKDGTFDLDLSSGDLQNGEQLFLDHYESGGFRLDWGNAQEGDLISSVAIDASVGNLGSEYIMTLNNTSTGNPTNDIPEPAAWALFLVGLGIMMKKRQA